MNWCFEKIPKFQLIIQLKWKMKQKIVIVYFFYRRIYHHLYYLW